MTLLYEALVAVGLIAAATAATYRISLLPTQKLFAGWAERTEQKLTTITVDDHGDHTIAHPKARWFMFQAVTCPECFGIWLTAIIWTTTMIAYSGHTAIPLQAQILGYPIVAGLQQKAVNTYV